MPSPQDNPPPSISSVWPLSREELNHVLTAGSVPWERLRGQRVFLTGGTGFVGTWLTTTFLWANQCLGLDAHLTVLSRRPQDFSRRTPSLAHDPAIRLVQGDVRSFDVAGPFDLVIHASAQEQIGEAAASYLVRLNDDVAATRQVLEAAQRWGTSRLLFTSSGAVYGPQPPELERIDESYPGAPASTDVGSAYGQAKRLSEYLCAVFAAQTDTVCTIARCFAFVGPFLPLDANYAVGNFLRDALRDGPIVVKGDGRTWRSYLHAADLTMWLWTILLRGQSGRAYNVGSDVGITIGDLAHRVAHLSDEGVEVQVTAPATEAYGLAPRYVPSVERARTELGLDITIDLDDALRRTWGWLRHQQTNQV